MSTEKAIFQTMNTWTCLDGCFLKSDNFKKQIFGENIDLSKSFQYLYYQIFITGIQQEKEKLFHRLMTTNISDFIKRPLCRFLAVHPNSWDWHQEKTISHYRKMVSTLVEWIKHPTISHGWDDGIILSIYQFTNGQNQFRFVNKQCFRLYYQHVKPLISLEVKGKGLRDLIYFLQIDQMLTNKTMVEKWFDILYEYETHCFPSEFIDSISKLCIPPYSEQISACCVSKGIPFPLDNSIYQNNKWLGSTTFQLAAKEEIKKENKLFTQIWPNGKRFQNK